MNHTTTCTLSFGSLDATHIYLRTNIPKHKNSILTRESFPLLFSYAYKTASCTITYAWTVARKARVDITKARLLLLIRIRSLAARPLGGVRRAA